MLTWVEKSIQQREAVLCGASRKIWELAEVKYHEQHSAQVLKDLLQKEGFRVEQAARELPTSFIAAYGAGAPVIGLLAEYDALPDCGRTPRRWRAAITATGMAADIICWALVLSARRWR